MQKSTEVMKMMGKLCKVSEISSTMQSLQQEMMKVCAMWQLLPRRLCGPCRANPCHGGGGKQSPRQLGLRCLCTRRVRRDGLRRSCVTGA